MKKIIFLTLLLFGCYIGFSQIRYTNCSETETNPLVGWDSWVTGITDIEISTKENGVYKVRIISHGAKYAMEIHEVKYNSLFEGHYKYDVVTSDGGLYKSLYILSDEKLSTLSKYPKPNAMVAVIYDNETVWAFKLNQ